MFTLRCFLVLLLAALGAACDTFTVTDMGIEISASPSSLEAEETSEIVVTLRRASADSRLPDNYRVDLVITQNESGASLRVMNNVADHEGRVKALYTAGPRKGNDIIQATGQNGETATVIIRVNHEPEEITISVSASPAQLNSREYSSIEITVTNNLNQPVRDHALNLTLIQNQSGAVLTLINAATDHRGKALALYQAGDGEGLDIVQATGETGVSIRTAIRVTFVDPAVRLEASAAPERLGPLEYSDIVLTATRTDGQPLSGYAIAFTFSRNTSGASLIVVNDHTDIRGQARAIYRAGPDGGIDMVRMTGAGGETVTLVLIVEEP